MTTLSSPWPLASAYVVIFGHYGEVTRHAQTRGVSRQWIYREAEAFQQAWLDQQQTIADLHNQLAQAQQQLADQAQRLAVAVVLDEDKQAHLASVGQARGVSLPDCWALIDVLIPGQGLSVPTLGRRAQAAGQQAGRLLKVFDEFTAARVREAAADEIYVTDPVRMVVEQESLCWVSGTFCVRVDGDGWQEEFQRLPNLEQVARAGGTALKKGVALVNDDRAEHQKPLVVDQGDHFHALRLGGTGLRKAEHQARQTFARAEQAEQHWQACHPRGEQGWQTACQRARRAWEKAEQAMDTWIALERRWDKTKAALQLITPQGELNTRAQAEAVLAETLPDLPEKDFAKVKGALQKPEVLNYLDHVQQKLAALPFAEEVKQAAVRQECLRRRPELLQGEGPAAAALRGVMVACLVVLSKADEGVGSRAVAAVQEIFRRAYRASSLVECINSVLRMQQSRHRKMTQGMRDLKRLYWNSHTFRTGRRRKTTPYQRLGVPWPAGMSWWEVLKLTPEQLRDKLSTVKEAA
jgi:cell division septum initiation protein DivIVA